jgi:hypothetical protein
LSAASPTAIAFVEIAPHELRTISLHQFHHRMAQWLAIKRWSSVKPGERRYERARKAVINDLIVWASIEGQARAMGIMVTRKEIAMTLGEIKRTNFKSHAQYVAYRRRIHYTRRDVVDAVRIQLLANSIEARVLNGVEGKAARRQARLDSPLPFQSAGDLGRFVLRVSWSRIAPMALHCRGLCQ